MTIKRLPDGFAELEAFVDDWDLPTSHARWIHRNQSPYADIMRFYEAMVARAEEATALIEGHPLHAMPDDVARLFRLVLALTHAAIAVELHKASHSPYSPVTHNLQLTVGIQPCG